MKTSITLPLFILCVVAGITNPARSQSLYDVPGFGWGAGSPAAPAQQYDLYNPQPQSSWGSDAGLRQFFASQPDPNWQPAPPPIPGYMGNPGGWAGGSLPTGTSSVEKINPNATPAELRAKAANLKRLAQAERDSSDRYKKMADDVCDRGNRYLDTGLPGTGSILVSQSIIWSQRASDAEIRALEFEEQAAELLARAEAAQQAANQHPNQPITKSTSATQSSRKEVPTSDESGKASPSSNLYFGLTPEEHVALARRMFKNP